MENYDFYIKKPAPNYECDFRPPDYYSHQENPFVDPPYMNWLLFFKNDPEITHTIISLLTFFIPLESGTYATNKTLAFYLKICDRQVRNIISMLRRKKIIFSVGEKYGWFVLRKLFLASDDNIEHIKKLETKKASSYEEA